MVSESEKTKAKVACLDDNSLGSGSENMKILSVSSVDCDMVSESKKTKIQVACSEDKSSGSRSGNMKIPSVSLADFITASQIKQHLSSFNPDNRVILKNEDTSSNPNLCELCWKERIMLAPAPIYCEICYFRILPNAPYHRPTEQENKDTSTKTNTDTDTKTKIDKDTKPQHCICTTCYKVSGSTIKLLNGGSISKAELIKAKNDQEQDDDISLWVACDRCEKWQHYICGLYNKERDQGEGEYICSKCRLTEIEEGNWAPQTVLAAKDLPSTNLSDHIEQRLVTHMKQEREETAKFRGTELKNVRPEITKNKEVEKQKVTVDALLDALVHAFGCKNKNIECTYPCCQNIKKLLLHDSTCRIPRCM
ncbi:zinc finger, TAZ-type containing protein [Tanacetum coccineum]